MGFWDRWAVEAEIEAEWKKLSEDMMDVDRPVSLEQMQEDEF